MLVSVATDTLLDKDVVGNIYFGENCWEGTVEVQTSAESLVTESAVTDESTVLDQIPKEPAEVTEQVSTPLEDQEAPSSSEIPTHVESEAVVQNGIQVSCAFKFQIGRYFIF